ncbi:MAG: fumarylacetoacetate hydrolase family protein [Alphaproteobacteria bacterium]|nr:fumarylacetoacetate hydrolase family protein [Alphaproteobacteria bacterium]
MAKLATPQLNSLAKAVDDATRAAKPIGQLSKRRGVNLSLDDAYRIQAASMARRKRRGERRSGVKMGFTSRAKALQMGVSDLIYGRLTEAMLIADGGVLSLNDFIHPRVEPEIAFLLKSPMAGRLSPAEAMTHVEAVAPALEIIDSRYKDFKFSLTDVVADNCSSAAYVVGPWNRPDRDISNLGMVLTFNGRPVEIGSSAAILGHPARSLADAARFAAETGDTLEAGFVVLAGGATAAVALAPDTTIRLDVEGLGSAGFTVTG